jgi:manganese oxidase
MLGRNFAAFAAQLALIAFQGVGSSGTSSPVDSADKAPVGVGLADLGYLAASPSGLLLTSDGDARAPADLTKSSAKPNENPVDAKTDRSADQPVISSPALPAQCTRTINADIVAIPQPIMLNRLGAAIPDGLIFALRSDTVGGAGSVLRPDRRPRPLVLRANVGDCLKITFTNSIPLNNFVNTTLPPAQTGTTEVSLHIQGLEWVTGTQDDGSFVGVNNSSLASVASASRTYTVFARKEGTFLLYTMGDTSSQGDQTQFPAGLQLVRGLFGALNVEPAGAEWYRSQVTADQLARATYNANQLGSNTLTCTTATNCTLTIAGPPPRVVQVTKTPGGGLNTLDNHPLINYGALDAAGQPILKMLDAANNIIHSDLTAIITGPNAGRFPGTTGANNPEPPCNAENDPALNPGHATLDPLFCEDPALPDRKQPYREITTIYHGALFPVASQAFPVFRDAQTSTTLVAGQDAFAINYGIAGIGAEVYANRIGVGPMGSCVDCKFEEFFLSSWSVGDPAMMVDKPANSGPPNTCTTTIAFNSPPCGGQKSSNSFPYAMQPTAKAAVAFFTDDPSNVYHSYINDHVKFRILHGGRDVSHVHHQHAHQWLQSPNSDESSYLDSQMISPGASYTLEMVYNGSGNRNKVVGDSIFHCHFYPHFAAGMWALWRTHDVFESGTFVFPQGTTIGGNDVSGQVVPGSRALPDGEITAGTPIPAVVPLPTLPMAPLPAYAQIQNNVQVDGAQITNGGQIVIGGTCKGNKINGLDVIGGCTDGQKLNGTVIDSQFNGTQMTGQFQPSLNNQIDNPGFPFFIPGVAGARAPHPPLDFAPDIVNGGFLDGGLPRHVVTGGSISYESHDAFDWSKDLATVNAVALPETGVDVELAAMNFFKQRCHQTFLPDGTPSNCAQTPPVGFIVNGLPLGPQSGAPFADPAVDDDGKAVGLKRTYKAAAIQLDVTFNKKRWHFPQQRILTLWEDVQPTFAYSPGGTAGRQPEPLFFRGNSGDIIEYWHTNLVPNYYLVDDFQVRTPTDILGQHIHLVKFDVTASDGAGNGFNYEDGTFSPEDVQATIKAINAAGGLLVGGVSQVLPGPKLPPKEIFDCASNPNALRCKPCPDNWTTTFRPQCLSWMGAQTTIQRWYLDPLQDNSQVDRTLRTVFTHDHFGPSTHQQAGLYAGLLVEPVGSTWQNSEDGSVLGRPATQPPIRPDGGPTSWKADVLAKDKTHHDVSYREFALEFQDLQLAYAWATIASTNPPRTAPDPDPRKGWMDPPYAIDAPKQPDLITTGLDPAPPGTQSVNYLNDPIPWRVGAFGDLSYVYDSSFTLASNLPPNGDPATPLMRAYQNDNVQVRVLVGAHVFAHQFDLEGPTWLAEPSWKNSGYRSAQPMGLSEHFELLFHVPSSSAPNTARKCPDGMSQVNCADYLYSPSLDDWGVANGMWGLFRAYDPTKVADKLQPLPNNPIGPAASVNYSTCPAHLAPPAVKRVFNITAITAQRALANVTPVPGVNPPVGQIVLNSRGQTLHMADGVLYVRTEDLDAVGGLKPGVAVEPLILRANAGDCIEVNLTNALDSFADVFQQRFRMAPPFDILNPVDQQPVFQSKMSGKVGLHPQLLGYDGAQSNGINVGWNRAGQQDQVAGWGQTIKYQWYAGKIDRDSSGNLAYTPVEFGSLNLFPSDPLFQHVNGLFGSMIIEPQGSTWKCGEPANLADCDPSGGPPPTTLASATVTLADHTTKFREFALMISDDMIISGGNSSAVNYRTEPGSFRYAGNATKDFSCMLSDQLVQQDPQTPIFAAEIGDKVRFRLAHPFGTGTSQVFTLHGHVWQRNPYQSDSTVIGDNGLSQWLGSRDNHGSSDHFDLVVDKAGGEGGQAGDYLYTVFDPFQAKLGAWGIFRVGHNNPTVQHEVACTPIPLPAVSPTAPALPKDDLPRFIRRPINISKDAKP